jgi:hypothetical protein
MPCLELVSNKTCDHGGNYHRCCIDRWLKTRPVCPLDNQSWIEGQATTRERELQQRVLGIQQPVDYVTKLLMDQTITPEEWEFIRTVQTYSSSIGPVLQNDDGWKSFMARFGHTDNKKRKASEEPGDCPTPKKSKLDDAASAATSVN